MRRILVVHCPIARNTAGNSFGPMTIRATTAITTNSPHPMSNTARYLQNLGAIMISTTAPITTRSPHAMSNIAFQLRRPPLPLGDLVYGNSVPQESAAPSGDRVRQARPELRQRRPHEASARLLAPAADASAA